MADELEKQRDELLQETEETPISDAEAEEVEGDDEPISESVEEQSQVDSEPGLLTYDYVTPEQIEDTDVKSLLENFVEPKSKPYGADEAKYALMHEAKKSADDDSVPERDYDDSKKSRGDSIGTMDYTLHGEYEGSCGDICLCSMPPQDSVITTDLENQLSQIQRKVNAIQKGLCTFEGERDKLKRDVAKCNCAHTSQALSADINEQIGKVAPIRQLRTLREAYDQLKQNYKEKVEEVSKMIMEKKIFFNKFKEIEKEKRDAEADADLAQQKFIQLEGRARRIQDARKQIEAKNKELQETKTKLVENEEKLRKAEELSQEQTLQLEEYKKKYCEAYEELEDQKRFVQRIKADNDILKEDLTIRIQHIRMKYQKEIEYLKPFPERLTKSQAELKEVLQTNSALQVKYEEAITQLHDAELKIQELSDEICKIIMEMKSGEGKCKNPKCEETKCENSMLKNKLRVIENELQEKELELRNKQIEVNELHEHMDTLRKEAARQVTQLRESTELTKRLLQRKMLDMEAEMAKKNAAIKAAEQDRENLRMRMQNQITFLNESFTSSQKKMRELEWKLADKCSPNEAGMFEEIPEKVSGSRTCDVNNCPAY